FQESMDSHVRRRAVDVRAPAQLVAEAVANRVLDLERGELEAFERALLRGDVDTQGALDLEVFRPVDGLRRGVEVRFAAVLELAYSPEDPGCDSRPEVRAVAGLPGARKGCPARRDGAALNSKGGKLLFENRLEPSRTAREENLRTA